MRWWWVWSTDALACGPWLEDPRLAWVSGEMLDSPTVHFRGEVDALIARLPPVPGAVPRRTERCEGEEMDLRAALGGGPEVEDTVWRWLAARCGEELLELDEVLAEVPLEFRLYAEGARLLSADDGGASARAKWEELLALPPEQRHWRSTWAASMIPASQRDEPGWTLGLARVRELALAGYADTLGLSLASLRQEASGRWAGEADLALARCLDYRASGGRTDPSCTSGLPALVERVVSLDDDGLRRAARDPAVAEVVAIWLTSRSQHAEGLPGWTRRWLQAAQQVGQRAGADRLGWAAWRQGEFAQAESWIAQADPASPLARWLSGKLALRRGDLPRAIAELQGAARLFGVESPLPFVGRPALSCAHGSGAGRAVAVELGVALVAADRYEEALQSFLAAGDWLDAAWVAERLLTTDELQSFVDLWFPEAPDAAVAAGQLSRLWLDPDEAAGAMRHLLARRLAREGRWAQALPYFPGELRTLAAQVHDALVRGRGLTRPAAERGEALWSAAFTLKQQGWELLATEMEPDFRVEGGHHQLPDTTSQRQVASDPGGPLSPSRAELARLGEQAGPTERYHFVYTAWALADEAVPLLPDDSELLAQAACTAGHWMGNRDPQRSWKMWRVLLTRARHTPIGEALAGRHRWWGLTEDGRCVPPAEPTSTAGQGRWSALGLAALLGLVGLAGLWRRRR
jgi:tetratricopeptide (TPR) repeat protein